MRVTAKRAACYLISSPERKVKWELMEEKLACGMSQTEQREGYRGYRDVIERRYLEGNGWYGF